MMSAQGQRAPNATTDRLRRSFDRPVLAGLILVLGVVCAIATAGAHEAGADYPYYRPTDTILVLGAVPQEIPPVVEALEGRIEKSLWGIPYWQGTIDGRPIVVAITGIGKTFTAMTTTRFLAEFRPRVVLMTGTAARLDPTLRTGDVIVATDTYEHDYGSLTAAGMVYRPMNGPDDGEQIENRFSPTEPWLARARLALADFEGEALTVAGASYTTRARLGVVASSDLFGVPERRIALLRTRFGADLMEMESAPLGAVCERFGVPFLVVRAGSNVAQEAPNDDYLVFGPIAAKSAARFTLHLIGYL